MKKVLLATTTIVGVSLAAGSASAAERIKLELGGYMEQYFGGFGTLKHSDNGKARDGMGIDTETRVYVQGSTVLDNGITVGAFISFVAEAHTDDSAEGNVEEQWAYMSGDFGAVYAGERNGVFDQFAVRAPNVSGRTGQDTMEWVKYYGGTDAGLNGFTDGTNYYTMGYIPTLETTFDDNSPRVTYVSPSWYGFSAGVSYAPNSDLGSVRGVRVREGRKGSNEIQFGLALDTAYNDIGILADASGATTLDGMDRWAYRAGLVLTYAGWSVGGSYMGTKADNAGWTGENWGSNGGWNGPGGIVGNAHAFEENIWEIGAAYEAGPYGVSLTYSQNDSSFGDAMTWQLGGAYKLGAGITAVSQIFYAESNAHSYAVEAFNGNGDYLGSAGAHTYRSGVGAMTGLILEF